MRLGHSWKWDQSRVSNPMGLSESPPTSELTNNPHARKLQARGLEHTIDQQKESQAIVLSSCCIPPEFDAYQNDAIRSQIADRNTCLIKRQNSLTPPTSSHTVHSSFSIFAVQSKVTEHVVPKRHLQVLTGQHEAKMLRKATWFKKLPYSCI